MKIFSKFRLMGQVLLTENTKNRTKKPKSNDKLAKSTKNPSCNTKNPTPLIKNYLLFHSFKELYSITSFILEEFSFISTYFSF